VMARRSSGARGFYCNQSTRTITCSYCGAGRHSRITLPKNHDTPTILDTFQRNSKSGTRVPYASEQVSK
jgi:hypothetical protein